MIVLLDTNQSQWEQAPEELGDSVTVGMLHTPQSNRAHRQGVKWGADNGGYQNFIADEFLNLLHKLKPYRADCLFVAAPDVVGSARRTLECFSHWYPKLAGWPIAFVAQDGQEDLPIPWPLISAVFIGGSTNWKTSESAKAICKAGKIMGKHVHVGRVNSPARFDLLDSWRCVDSIDGSGISQYSHMRVRLTEGIPLFQKREAPCV